MDSVVVDQVWDSSVQKGQRDSRKVLFWEAGVRADQTDTGWERTKKYWDNNTETAYTGLGPWPDPGVGGEMLNAMERGWERGRARKK